MIHIKGSNIAFYISKNSQAGDVQRNIERLQRVISSVKDHFTEPISNRPFLIIFGWQSAELFGDYGKTIFNREVKEFKEDYPDWLDEISELDLVNFELFVLIFREVGESDNDIFITLTIAHEFQHIAQYLEERQLFFQASLLKSFRKQEGNYTNECYRSFPTEKDAFTTSKRICFELYGEDIVKRYLVNQTEDRFLLPDERPYWKDLLDLKIDNKFSWKEDIRHIWKESSAKIKMKLDCHKRSTTLSIQEKSFIQEGDEYEKNFEPLT